MPLAAPVSDISDRSGKPSRGAIERAVIHGFFSETFCPPQSGHRLAFPVFASALLLRAPTPSSPTWPRRSTPMGAGTSPCSSTDLDIEMVGLDGSPLRRLVLDPTKDYQRIP